MLLMIFEYVIAFAWGCSCLLFILFCYFDACGFVLWIYSFADLTLGLVVYCVGWLFWVCVVVCFGFNYLNCCL